MKTLHASVVGFLAVLSLAALRPPSSLALGLALQGPPPPPTWKKECFFENVGSEGCDLKVRMTYDPNGPCGSADCPQYCVQLIVDCPPGIPSGDPGEHCESNVRCELCCYDNSKICLVCDGQRFCVQPAAGKDWDDVADDCSNLVVTVS